VVRRPGGDRRPGWADHHHRSVVDQAALHGLLAKIRDLGLPLISVQQIQPR
jgi:hypothetical protein